MNNEQDNKLFSDLVQVGRWVIHDGKVAFVLVKMIQFEWLVGETQPESAIGVNPQRIDRSQQDDVTHIELDRQVQLDATEENGAIDVSLSNFRTANGQPQNKIQVVRYVSV